MIELWNDCKYNKKTTQPVFTCSKSKMETRAQRVKSAQLTIKSIDAFLWILQNF